MRDAQGRSEWQGLPFSLVKELRKNVIDYGLGSPHVQSLVQNVFFSYELAPFDIKQISSLIFMLTQKVLLESHWCSACEIATIDNLDRPDGDPLRGAGILQLMGEPPVQTPQLQARLNPSILQQSRQLAYQSILKTADLARTTQAFVSIRQGDNVAFMSFIDKLKEAIEKQVENKASLVASLQTLQNLVEMMEACQKGGSLEHQVQAMAVAFEVVRVSNRAWFRCGETGYFKRKCPKAKSQPSVGPGPCPKCGKGRHYANRCRSKWDRNWKPVSGNFQNSAKRVCAQTQVS